MLACSANANAQFGRVLNKVKQKAKDKIERKVDKTIDKVLDGAEKKMDNTVNDAVKGKDGTATVSEDGTTASQVSDPQKPPLAGTTTTLWPAMKSSSKILWRMSR